MRPGKAKDNLDDKKLPQVGTPTPPVGGRRRLAGWALLGLFQLSLAAGAFRLGSRLGGPEPSAAVESPAEEPEKDVAPWKQDPAEKAAGPAARNELDEVSRLLRAGRYELGLTLCRSFGDRAAAGLGEAFQYRVALCLEGLGRWDEALTAYRRLAGRAASARMGAVALLGQARVWLRMRRPAESKALLCDLIRRSALPALRDQPFLADARYLLALAAPLELLPNEPPGPFNDNPVNPLTSDWSLESALDWDKPGAKEEAAAGEDEVVEVQPGAVTLVRISVHQMPVTGLLDRLAEQARLRIEWTARARQQVEGRAVVVALERTSLPDALRVLAEPLGLVWTIREGKLNLSGEEETTAEELRQMRLGNARRALREAVMMNQRHPLTPAAFLELGGLEALTGRHDEALSWYGRLVREWPRSPLAIEAQYNLGLLRCRQGDRAGARQAFYRVVDRAPAHELAPLAYWRVGRTYLDEGDPEPALSPLRRALQGGAGSSAQAAAAITLAAAHLLTDNPRAANAVLLEHRELVGGESCHHSAAFLDTLARFHAVTDARQRQREAGDLLAALLALPDDPILGPCGLLLRGRAYRELGMQEEMVRAYEKALPKLRGPLASDVGLALAEAYCTSDKREAAIELYGKLAAAAPSAGARRARIRLAEIALEQKKSQDCLKSCRELLREKTGVDVAAVLRLMAAAYEQAGERDKAIRCLSGELPP